MKVKVLLCNCKGLCDSFKDTDVNTLPFQVESELDVEYAVVHPQLCGQGGNTVLAEVLRETDADTHLVVGACAPDVQAKLFKKVLKVAEFDAGRFAPVDIRGTDNAGILDRLRETVDGIQAPAEEKSAETVGQA